MVRPSPSSATRLPPRSSARSTVGVYHENPSVPTMRVLIASAAAPASHRVDLRQPLEAGGCSGCELVVRRFGRDDGCRFRVSFARGLAQPGIQLHGVGENRRALAAGHTVNRHPPLVAPPLDRADVATEVIGDGFPTVEPIRRGGSHMVLVWECGRARVYRKTATGCNQPRRVSDDGRSARQILTSAVIQRQKQPLSQPVS